MTTLSFTQLHDESIWNQQIFKYSFELWRSLEPSTHAIDRQEKIHACVWRLKIASCKHASLKSIRFSQKKKRSDLVFPHLFHSSVWAMLGHLTLNLFDIQEILQYFWSEFNHFRINVSVSSAISLIVIWWLSNSYFLLFQSKILVIFNSHPSWKCLYHLYMLIVFIEVLPKSIFNICNVVFVSYCIPKTGCNADSL